MPASCALALAPVLTEGAAECGWPPMILRVTTAASYAASCSTARLVIAITTPGPVRDLTGWPRGVSSKCLARAAHCVRSDAGDSYAVLA